MCSSNRGDRGPGFDGQSRMLSAAPRPDDVQCVSGRLGFDGWPLGQPEFGSAAVVAGRSVEPNHAATVAALRCSFRLDASVSARVPETPARDGGCCTKPVWLTHRIRGGRRPSRKGPTTAALSHRSDASSRPRAESSHHRLTHRIAGPFVQQPRRAAGAQRETLLVHESWRSAASRDAGGAYLSTVGKTHGR
jgi:hypothetical protein